MLARWLGLFLTVQWISIAPSFAEGDVSATGAHSTSTQGEMAPPTLQNAVRIFPEPHLSLLIPKGWFACDEATNKLLGGVAAPQELLTSLCTPNAPGTPIRLAYPDPTEPMMIVMNFNRGERITSNLFDSVTPDQLKRLADGMCANVTKVQSLSDTHCDGEAHAIAGHISIVGDAAGTRTASSEKVLMHFMIIPVNGGIDSITLRDDEADHAKTGPILDAIANSIVVE